GFGYVAAAASEPAPAARQSAAASATARPPTRRAGLRRVRTPNIIDLRWPIRGIAARPGVWGSPRTHGCGRVEARRIRAEGGKEGQLREHAARRPAPRA